jgi:hypothetical protein
MYAAAPALHRASLSRFGAQELAALRTRLGRLDLAPLSKQELGNRITRDIIHVCQHFVFNGLQVSIFQVNKLARSSEDLNEHVRDFIQRASFRGRIHDQISQKNPPNHPIALIEPRSIVIPPPPPDDTTPALQTMSCTRRVPRSTLLDRLGIFRLIE